MAIAVTDILGDFWTSGSVSAYPTAPQANMATDMQVQAGTSAPVGGATTSGGVGAVNATAGSGSVANLRWSAGIVLFSIVLLWLLGGIVFKGVKL